MDQERVGIEEMCMKDTEGYICEPGEVGPYEKLCKNQLPQEMADDWSESRHY